MVEVLAKGDVEKYLEIDNSVVKTLFDYVKGQTFFKYKEAMSTLKSRHHGYESEDFIQEVMQLVLTSLQTKKFPTLGQLKKFVRCTMEFHYLKEKRKYFYTKSRGSFLTTSIEEPLSDSRTIADTISYNKVIDTGSFDLHRIMSKNLFLQYDWHICKIGKLRDFKQTSNGLLLSINQFIKLQMYYGMRETCNYYKRRGFYMTKTTFEILSQAIIDYAIEQNLLEKEITVIKKKKELSTSKETESYMTNSLKV